MSRRSCEPAPPHGCQDDPTEVGDRQLVVAGGDASPFFDLVERPLNDVALAVKVLVEGWWSSPCGALAAAVLNLVAAFRDAGCDPEPSQRFAGRGVGVGLVGQDDVGTEPSRGCGRVKDRDGDVVQQW